MTRQEQLKFCKICRNKSFNPQKGIVCKLTNDVADFEEKCDNFLIDESIQSLENFRKSEAVIEKVKKIPKEHKQIKEEIVKEDIYLILGISLFTTFLVRLTAYAEVYSAFNPLAFVFIFISIVMAVLFRRRKEKRIRFFGDMKFKLIFSLAVTLFNMIYFLIVYEEWGGLPLAISGLLVLTFILCLLSFIVTQPVNFLYQRIFSQNE